MPGRSRVQAAVDTSLCRRCQTDEPVITVRTEPLCEACFTRYVSTKVVKRMESFRVRHTEPGTRRSLLIPLSFGVSSTVMLHVLSQHLQGQAERTGRTGYKLHVLHVAVEPKATVHDSAIERVKSRYPEHSYSVLHLSDAITPDELEQIAALSAQNSQSEEDRASLDVSSLLESLKSATSKADVSQILLRKAVTSFAKTNDCEAVLWGDSTTRLAERTLAETAKGRGYSLPWIMADGQSPHGMPFYFPVRDLLSKEMDQFAAFTEPPLGTIIVTADARPPVSTKNTTIDSLMKQYFGSVDREHPSIVANVVRTTGKLQNIPLSATEKQCELCDMPLNDQAPEKSRLCYGCIRTLSSDA